VAALCGGAYYLVHRPDRAVAPSAAPGRQHEVFPVADMERLTECLVRSGTDDRMRARRSASGDVCVDSVGLRVESMSYAREGAPVMERFSFCLRPARAGPERIRVDLRASHRSVDVGRGFRVNCHSGSGYGPLSRAVPDRGVEAALVFDRARRCLEAE